MSDKEIKEIYDGIEMPAELREKILTAMNNSSAKEKAKSKHMPRKRFILTAAAIMLSFTMLVSAATVLYNIYSNVYLIPGQGLFEGLNESVMAMPKVLHFGNATIEMAMTYEQDGVNIFSMEIWYSGIREGYITSKTYATHYKDLEMIFPDGTSMPISSGDALTGWSSASESNGYKGAYECKFIYKYENFPDQTEFVLKNDMLDISVEVSLAPFAEINKNIKVTDNGIKRIKIIPAAEGSRILSYKVEILKPSVLEALVNSQSQTGYASYGFYGFRSYHPYQGEEEITNEIIYEDGSKYDIGGSGSMINGMSIFSENGDYDYHIFGELSLNNDITSKIERIIIRELRASISFNPINVSVPLPEKGGRIDFETPFELAEIGGFSIATDAIERSDYELKLYIKQDNIKYTGLEDVSDIRFPINGSMTSKEINGEMYYIHTLSLYSNKQYKSSDTTFEFELMRVEYTINGYWEIDFE